ncbi:MAG: RHS repeat domain-containing protein [Candidatus Binataceae bacterium]
MSDANNNTTGYSYDARNRRITRTDALGKSASYSYDNDSNLAQYTDRRGKSTVYQYDGLSRRTVAGFGQNGGNYESTVNYPS